MRHLYSILFYLLLPFIVARLWWRGRRAPAYRQRWAERFGFFPTPAPVREGKRCIWVHAVSVGETIAAAPMIRALQARYPQLPLLVTTTTPTGSERVRALFGASVMHVYGPYDAPDCVARFLNRARPIAAIVVETELWPNLVAGCHRRGVPMLVANARLSARSARGYARVASLTRPMLRSLACVVAQSAQDGERFVALGLPAERLRVSGSVKFDITLDAAVRSQAEAFAQQLGQRFVWIAASTHPGEDEAMLAAHRLLRVQVPGALLLLVPRHPERFGPVAELIDEAGFRYVRRSTGKVPQPVDAVLLGDTMGELLLLLGAAEVAFVGGSLVERGGHNMLEPAAWALPILTGPSDFNFAEASRLLQTAGALVQVADSDALAHELELLAAAPSERHRRGVSALAVVEANRGALARLLDAIAEIVPAEQGC